MKFPFPFSKWDFLPRFLPILYLYKKSKGKKEKKKRENAEKGYDECGGVNNGDSEFSGSRERRKWREKKKRVCNDDVYGYAPRLRVLRGYTCHAEIAPSAQRRRRPRRHCLPRRSSSLGSCSVSYLYQLSCVSSLSFFFFFFISLHLLFEIWKIN